MMLAYIIFFKMILFNGFSDKEACFLSLFIITFYYFLSL